MSKIAYNGVIIDIFTEYYNDEQSNCSLNNQHNNQNNHNVIKIVFIDECNNICGLVLHKYIFTISTQDNYYNCQNIEDVMKIINNSFKNETINFTFTINSKNNVVLNLKCYNKNDKTEKYIKINLWDCFDDVKVYEFI